MMKKIVLLVMMLCMMSSLAGCGKESEELDVRDLVYNYELLPCVNEIKGEVSFYKITQDSIYIQAMEWPEIVNAESEQPATVHYYKCDMNGENLVEIPYKGDKSDDEWLYSMDVTSEGKLWLLYSRYSEESVGNRYLLRKVSGDGTVEKEIDAGKAVGVDEFFVQDVKCDGDGNLYMQSDSNLYIFDADGEFIGTLESERMIACLIRTADGEMFAGFDSANGLAVKKVNAEELQFCESQETGVSYYNVISFIDGAEHDFYFTDGDGLYGYDLSDRQTVPVADWISCNMNASDIGSIQVRSGDIMYAVYGGGAGEQPYGLYILRKADPKDVKIKERITYASLYPDESVKQQAIRFNKSQDDYQVVVKDYGQSENPQQAMHKDLISGGVIDIADLSGISSDKYMTGNMFVDLYSFMEKDDAITKEDLIESARKVMETDGKLYRITPTFGLNGIVMRKEDLQAGGNVTLSHVKNLEADGARMFYMETRESVLSRAVEMNYSEYMDWEKGVCSFDTPDFQGMLEYAQEYPSEEEIVWEEDTKSMTSMVREGEILSASVYNFSMSELQLYEEMFEDEFSLVGFMSEKYSGIPLSMDREFVICADSGHKEGAWEFLKTYLTREAISTQFVSDEYLGTPIRKDSLEDKIRRFTITETCTDDFGNVMVPISYEWGYEEIQLQVGPLNEQQVALYREMVQSADHRYVYDSDVITMVQEEAEDYFKGQISAEEACENMQERISVYMEDYR